MRTNWLVIAALSSGLGMGLGTLSAAAHEHKEAMPATIGGIWHEVKEHEEELGEKIEAFKLDEVHEAAYEIRDYVDALVEKSGDLPADKLELVKANAQAVSHLATKLDAAGDSNNEAATKELYGKLQKVLKDIAAQYPAEMLAAGSDEDASTPAPSVIYTCPMHPEVVSAVPGKCPKCGMNLMPKK